MTVIPLSKLLFEEVCCALNNVFTAFEIESRISIAERMTE